MNGVWPAIAGRCRMVTIDVATSNAGMIRAFTRAVNPLQILLYPTWFGISVIVKDDNKRMLIVLSNQFSLVKKTRHKYF